VEDISYGIPALHKEIEDFVQWVSPTEEEKKMRQEVLGKIQSVVQILWPQARVEIIGSYKTELCLPTSDIDLVIFAPFREATDALPLFQLSLLLEEHQLSSPNGVKVITTAKVPIIKFQELKSRCYIDIAFEVNTGIENTKIVQSFLAQYPLLRPLSLVIKYYLKQNYLNDTWSGGIGSYTLVILITSYLQQHSKSRGLSDNENLAELLIGFFEFYGRKFNYVENGISVKDKCYYNKKSKRWYNDRFPNSLSVEDPHNPEIDVGSASFEIFKAKTAFEEAFYRLSEILPYPCLSYLAQSDIIRPQFVTSFRDHIKQTYIQESFYTNKKRATKPYSKDKTVKYNSRKPQTKHSQLSYSYTWENQLYYRPVIHHNDDTPQLPLLDKNNNAPSQVSYYPVRKYTSPNRCWNKLDLQNNRKTHNSFSAGVSVIHN